MEVKDRVEKNEIGKMKQRPDLLGLVTVRNLDFLWRAVGSQQSF